jgi:hypothetical protein
VRNYNSSKKDLGTLTKLGTVEILGSFGCTSTCCSAVNGLTAALVSVFSTALCNCVDADWFLLSFMMKLLFLSKFGLLLFLYVTRLLGVAYGELDTAWVNMRLTAASDQLEYLSHNS